MINEAQTFPSAGSSSSQNYSYSPPAHPHDCGTTPSYQECDGAPCRCNYHSAHEDEDLTAFAHLMNHHAQQPQPHDTHTFSYQHFSLQRTDTISSTATADNLPGPGRALDNLFQYLGRKVEHSLNRMAKKIGVGPAAEEEELENLVTFMDASAFDYEPFPLQRTSTISTSATADNLPGPGRALDNLYQYLGQKVEESFNQIARNIGAGPAAEEEKLRRLARFMEIYRNERASNAKMSIHEKSVKKRSRDIDASCKKLVKYSTSHVSSTQLRSFLAIATLSPKSSAVSASLKKHDAGKKIASTIRSLPRIHKECRSIQSRWNIGCAFGDEECDDLLCSSRRALYCLEDNELNNIAKALDRCKYVELDWVQTWGSLGTTFLMYLTHPELSFLALRYVNSICFKGLRYLSISRGRAGSLDDRFYELVAQLLTLVQTVNACTHNPSSVVDISELAAAVEIAFFFDWEGHVLYPPLQPQESQESWSVSKVDSTRQMEQLCSAYAGAIDKFGDYANFTVGSLRRFYYCHMPSLGGVTNDGTEYRIGNAFIVRNVRVDGVPRLEISEMLIP